MCSDSKNNKQIKKFMKTVIMTVIAILVILMVAGLNIKTDPFKIEFKNWQTLVGWTIIVIGVSFLTVTSDMKTAKKYYQEGYKAGITEFTSELEKELGKSFKLESDARITKE